MMVDSLTRLGLCSLNAVLFAVGVAFCCAAMAADAPALKTAEPDPAAVRFGQAVSTKYRVGARITAKGGDVRDIYIMVAVPLECAEQEVNVLEEDYSPQVEHVDFRTLPTDRRAEPGARQMLISLSQLAAGQEAHALITYEVVTKAILQPEQTEALKIPTKVDRELKPFLTTSPFINVGHPKVRAAVKEALAAAESAPKAGATGNDAGEKIPASEAAGDESNQPANAVVKDDKKAESKVAEFKTGDGEKADVVPASSGKVTDWQRVEAIYDYVQKHISYEAGAPDKAALQTLEDGKADCHGLAALFVAMCRTAKVPARMVWVDGHQYAEFCLVDEAGKTHWYPVQSAGTRAFGEMPVPKVILQKGDKFIVPERRREQLRYASDFTTAKAEAGNKPSVKYVREQL
jgi:transglutaminase-like putative cysteine protease